MPLLAFPVVAQRTGIEAQEGVRIAPRRPLQLRPTYQASVFSAHESKRIRKAFATLAEARGWRAETQTGVRRGTLRAPAHTTVAEAAEELVEGMRSGRVRTRSGDPYKPSAIRSYAAALRDHVVPRIGRTRLGDVQHRDVQRIADELLAAGRDPSTIRNALMPLRAIFRARGRGRRRRGEPVHSPSPAGRPRPARAQRVAGRGRAAVGCSPRARSADLGDRAVRRSPPRRADGAALGCRRPRERRHPRRACVRREGAHRGRAEEPRWPPVGPIVGALRDLLVVHEARQDWRDGLVFGGDAPFQPSNLWRRAQRAWSRAGLQPIGLHEARTRSRQSSSPPASTRRRSRPPWATRRSRRRTTCTGS